MVVSHIRFYITDDSRDLKKLKAKRHLKQNIETFSAYFTRSNITLCIELIIFIYTEREAQLFK